MNLTKKQWRDLEKLLSVPWGRATLRVDGYDLTLQVERISELRYAIFPYVNGLFWGRWLLRNEEGDWCEEARRFLPLVTRALWSSAKLKRLKISKRTATKMGLTGDYDSRRSHWTSFSALRLHLIKNNADIEVMPE